MPELPEVEHARRSVAAWCVGRRVLRAEVPPSRLLRGIAPEALAGGLAGAAVGGAERRGKHLLIELDGARALHVHLGMSGRLERHPDLGAARARAHARLALALDDGTAVCLSDARMLGRIELGALAAIRARAWAGLGPDPLHDGLDGAALAARLAGTRRAIKVALMDQAVVAGLGNIYATEALWRARIHPEVPAAALRPGATARLAAAIHQALEAGLRALAEDEARHGRVRYLSDGDAPALGPFAVYGRGGAACPRCAAGVIRRAVQAGRATYHCPRCQRTPRRSLHAGRPL